MAITATFQANFDQFVAAVKSADDSLRGIEGSAKNVGAAIVASLASTEIRRFATDVRTAATEFIGAFAEEEAAVKKLEVALQAQGTGAAMAQYRALATEFQNTTTFSDDLVMSMQALLVQVGGVMPAQMAAALTASADLSAGLGINLEAATMLVARAFGQGGEQLGKLKALLGDSVKPGADMAEVMKAINDKFGGQATAQMETYTGRMAALTNQMSDFKEQVGNLIVVALTPLLEWFGKLPQSAQTAIIGVVALGTALAPLALSIAAVSTVITPLIPLISVALTGAFAAILPFLGTAGLIAVGVIGLIAVFRNLDAIVGIARSVYEGIKAWLVDRFQAVMVTIKGYVDTIIGWWRGMLATVGAAVTVGAPALPAGFKGGPVPSFAGGGVGDFGSGTLAMLHGREAIVPLGNGGGSMGTVINNYIDARESFYDTPAGVQRLADKVGASLAASLRNRGATM